jgi:diguanylate cyclase (GGDEF)-like protein
MGDTVQRLLDLHDRDASRGIALVMFDIDHFKQINDVYGHIAGDEVLNAVGRVLLHETRAADVPVRFGGEEFAVFIAARTVYDAQTFAERVRAAVEKLSFEGTNGRFSVTISAGIACRNRGEPLLTMLNRADKQLYCAKECGRNRICVELLPSCP